MALLREAGRLAMEAQAQRPTGIKWLDDGVESLLPTDTILALAWDTEGDVHLVMNEGNAEVELSGTKASLSKPIELGSAQHI